MNTAPQIWMEEDYGKVDLGAVPQPVPVSPVPKGLTAAAWLREVLKKRKESVEQLEVARSSLERSKLDEERALELDGDEADDRLKTAQISQSMYSARITKLETKVAQSFKDLCAALRMASKEHNTRVMIESAKRRACYSQRIADAIEGLTERPGWQTAIEEILLYSGPCERVETLRMPEHFDESLEAGVLSWATTVLSKSDRLEIELQGSGIL